MTHSFHPSHSDESSAPADSQHPSQQHSHEKDDGMGQRGVTRPMMQHDGEHESKLEQEGHEHPGMMSEQQRRAMLNEHHQQTLWVYWAVLMLGIWMVAAPATFDYSLGTAEPSGGREVWLSRDVRAAAMTWSDVFSGILLIFFGWRSLTPDRPISQWLSCFAGVWLTFAPMIFWSPSAAAYLNDTLVGALVIALTVLIPGMPNMILFMKMGGDRPPGWSYNPSSWPQRWIMIALGLAGWLVSRYLAAFQLGYIDQIWDPFFGEGSRRVLNSKMSHMWPISDAALGTVSYTFEFLMGFMGSPARWRTMPWMVTLFGILVIPLGLTHIVLVISQPVVVGHWCAFCLLAAAIMLPMIPLEVDEVVAMGQHLVHARRAGTSLWQAFWKGGPADQAGKDKRSPPLAYLPQQPGAVFLASLWGVSCPWTLTTSAVIGLWLMFSPTMFGIDPPASHVDHLAGALVLSVAVISMGEVVRSGRFLNILLGLVLVAVPWLMEDSTTISRLNSAACGLLIIALAIPRGLKTEQYGLWDQFVR